MTHLGTGQQGLAVGRGPPSFVGRPSPLKPNPVRQTTVMSIRHAQQELAEELLDLVSRTGAENAFVFDAWGLIWCSASLTYGDDRERLYHQVKTILEGLKPPLQRGAKLDRMFTNDVSPMYCVSFATTYVLALWIAPDTNMFLMRRLTKEALPRIEAMTLSLPPPDGSGGSSGAQHGRA